MSKRKVGIGHNLPRIVGRTIKITIPDQNPRPGRKPCKPEKYLYYVTEENPRKACAMARAYAGTKGLKGARARTQRIFRRDWDRFAQFPPGYVSEGTKLP